MMNKKYKIILIKYSNNIKNSKAIAYKNSNKSSNKSRIIPINIKIIITNN